MNFFKQIFSDHNNQASSKRIVSIIFALSALVLVFVFPSHANFDFALASMLSFAGAALGLSSYEKINTTKIDGNQERT